MSARHSVWQRSRIPLLAVVLGSAVTLIAVGLVALIRLCTNLAFHGSFSAAEAVPDFSTWGAWGILVPVIGGLIIGAMARWGSPAIRGHGIPEAMQAIGTADSRIPARVAILSRSPRRSRSAPAGPSARKVRSSRLAARWVHWWANGFPAARCSARSCSPPEPPRA